MSRGNREIKIEKSKLIEQIKTNKEVHIKEYKEAVTAYKTEVLKQLSELKSKIESNDLEIRLDLTKPINNSENYDKTIEMFNWEVEDLVILSQGEFKEYVQDDNDFSRSAKFSNSMYVG